MTTKEIQKRIATMTDRQFANVLALVKQGYGAHSISLESTATLKQINAVFQLVEQSK